MEASATFGESAFDRTPPYSMEAETAVLGGMLIDKEAVTRAVEHLDDSMFYSEGNRRLYRAMLRLFERGDVVDVITVSEELKKTSELESAGGYDYLGALVGAVPTAANLEYHAGIIRDKALLRRLLEKASQIIRDVYDQGQQEVEEILDQAEGRIFAVAESHRRAGFEPIKKVLWSAFEHIDEMQDSNTGLTGIPTGFPDLDRMTTGSTSGSESRVQEVSIISRGLKALARELEVPVVALSQLSRGPEQRTDKRPMLSDLRESGSIEQDADVVMFLYRPEYYAPPEKREELAGKAELMISKQRNGPTGVVHLVFQKAYTRFDSAVGGVAPPGEAGPGYPV